MNTEGLYVIGWLLVLGMLWGYYLLLSYIKKRKRKIEEEKERELDNLWIERKARARISVYEFRKKGHLINPITFTNGVTVSFVEKGSLTKELMGYSSFGIEYKINGKLYYDILCYSYDIYNIIIDDKYSLEDLKGYDWIIETAYNFTEDRINKIQEDRVEEESFVKSVKNNDIVAKIKQ